MEDNIIATAAPDTVAKIAQKHRMAAKLVEEVSALCNARDALIQRVKNEVFFPETRDFLIMMLKGQVVFRSETSAQEKGKKQKTRQGKGTRKGTRGKKGKLLYKELGLTKKQLDELADELANTPLKVLRLRQFVSAPLRAANFDNLLPLLLLTEAEVANIQGINPGGAAIVVRRLARYVEKHILPKLKGDNETTNTKAFKELAELNLPFVVWLDLSPIAAMAMEYMPIEDLKLSTALSKLVYRGGFGAVGDLLHTKMKELFVLIPHFGPSRLEELKHKIYVVAMTATKPESTEAKKDDLNLGLLAKRLEEATEGIKEEAAPLAMYTEPS